MARSDVDGDQRMDRLDDVAVRMLLSYCDQSISCDVDANICKQAIRTRRDFRRSAARDLLVDLIVAEIDEIHDVVTDSIGAPRRNYRPAI